MEQKNTHGTEEKQGKNRHGTEEEEALSEASATEQKNKVISGEGQGRPSNTYGGATCRNEYIIHQAIAAYLKFREVCGDEEDEMWWVQTNLPNEPVEFKLAPDDEKMLARCYAWINEYRTEQDLTKWWELKPTEEIISMLKPMLKDLGLSQDAYEEIFQMIEMLKSRTGFIDAGAAPVLVLREKL